MSTETDTIEAYAEELWNHHYGLTWDEISEADRDLYRAHATSLREYHQWRGVTA